MVDEATIKRLVKEALDERDEETSKRKLKIKKSEIETPTDDEVDEILREIGQEKDTDKYLCPKCDYKADKPFSTCPNCGQTDIVWDE